MEDATSPAWGDPYGSSAWANPSPPAASTSKLDDWGADSDEEVSALHTRSAPTLTAEDDDFGDAAEPDDDFGDFDEGDAAFTEEPVSFDQIDEPFAIRPGARPDELAPRIAALFEQIWPLAASALSTEPERQVGGDAQTLVSEESRAVFNLLCQPLPVRPVDWKRSRVRREHLVALGVPVNVDEFAAPETPIRPPLVTQVPRAAGPSSAPTKQGSTPITRHSSVHVQRPMPSLDRAKAAELLAFSSEQLSLMPLAKLETIRRELQDLAADASATLTKSLERREALSTAGEAYDAKIQELVAAAQRLKPGPGGSNVKRSSSTSSRWGRNSPNRPASPAFGGSGKR